MDFTITYLLVSCVITIWLYFKWAFMYWKRKHVPFVKPVFPFGHILPLLTSRIYVGEGLKNFYILFKSKGHKHLGTYFLCWPRYIPIDNKIIKCILQQDFNNFKDRGFYFNEKNDPLSANLFSLGGERWRNLRSKLSPAFSIAKLKTMFDSLLICSNGLKNALTEFEKSTGIINAKLLARNFSINVIGLCAFGVDCNCFENPNSEFVKFGLSTFDYSSWIRRMKMCFAFAMPNFALSLGVEVFGKKHTHFFTNLVKETMDFREKNNIKRKDLVQLLLDLKNRDNITEEESKQWQGSTTIEELAAQVFIFFSAGFETTSNTLSYCLYELALNINIQEKMRKEIKNFLNKYNGNITYDSLSDMKYTTQVLEETLRKYPPVAFIGRVCEGDYRIPDTNIILDKGTYIDISILGIHHDPEFYPDAEKFDPDRFSDSNKKSRPSCTYLPFGEGPRTCIGLRFAMMELKVALIVILQEYELSLNEKTRCPLEIEPHSFTLTCKQDILLNIKKILQD